MKGSFNELLNELNSADSSVGLLPIDNIEDAIEIVKEYNFYIASSDENHLIISLFNHDYSISLSEEAWTIEKIVEKASIGQSIEITDFYDEIAWYSKMVGRQFKVIEVNESDIKVKRGNGRYSYYVGHNDYKVIK